MTRFYSQLNTIIGLTGISIQLTMLYPWHEVISVEIRQLQKQQDDLQALITKLQPLPAPAPAPASLPK